MTIDLSQLDTKRYPIGDWRYEVACNYTHLGYYEWVYNKMESDRDDPEPAPISADGHSRAINPYVRDQYPREKDAAW